MLLRISSGKYSYYTRFWITLTSFNVQISPNRKNLLQAKYCARKRLEVDLLIICLDYWLFGLILCIVLYVVLINSLAVSMYKPYG